MNKDKEFNLSEEEINMVITDDFTSKPPNNKKKTLSDAEITNLKNTIVKNININRSIFQKILDIKIENFNDKFEKLFNNFNSINQKLTFINSKINDFERKFNMIFKFLNNFNINSNEIKFNNIKNDNIKSTHINPFSKTQSNINNNNSLKENNFNNSNPFLNNNTKNSINSINNNTNTKSHKIFNNNINNHNSKITDSDTDSSDNIDKKPIKRKKKKTTNSNVNLLYKILFIFKSNNKETFLDFYKNDLDLNSIYDFIIFYDDKNPSLNLYYLYLHYKCRTRLDVNQFKNWEFLDYANKNKTILKQFTEFYKIVFDHSKYSNNNINNNNK